MKKLIVISVIAFGFALLFSLAPSAGAKTSVVLVGTNTFPDDLEAVQAAVDVANDVILEGTFNFGDGTLAITRNITLRGRGDAVILNGGSVAEDSASIHALSPATEVEIRNLNMVGSPNVAILTSGVTADIRHNNITAPYGIGIVEGTGSWIRENSVSDTSEGIFVLFSDSIDMRNNVIEARDVGIFVAATSQSNFTNNSVLIVGNSTGLYGVGRTGIFLNPYGGGNSGNIFSNTSLDGEMTYGYLLGEGAQYNTIKIQPRNLDGAIFVPPPVFGLCNNGPQDPNPSGATVIFVKESVWGPAAIGNIVKNRSRVASFLDCGIDNEVK